MMPQSKLASGHVKTLKGVLVAAALFFQTSCKTGNSESSDVAALNRRDSRQNQDLVTLVPQQTRVIAGRFQCPTSGEVKVLFLDADSTLRVSRSGVVTADNETDVYTLPFLETQLNAYSQQGYLVAIVSNQGGATQNGAVVPALEEKAAKALIFTATQIAHLGGVIDYIDYAPAYDGFRKPAIGMATRLDGIVHSKCGVGIDWKKFLMVGDSAYKKAVDTRPADANGSVRPAENFSNSDRFFAINVALSYFNERAAPLGWQRQTTVVTTQQQLEAVKAEIKAKRQDPQLSRDLASLLKFEDEDSRYGEGQFAEPNDFFGWTPYGVTLIEDKVVLKAFVDKITVTPGAPDMSAYLQVNGPIQ